MARVGKVWQPRAGSVRLVIDMNMGLDWVDCLAGAGHRAVHWSSVGPRDEADEEIMRWARGNGHSILTADLDFGAHLIRRGESGPSIIQLRTSDTIVRLAGPLVLSAIRETEADLNAGVLVTVERERCRVRRLAAATPLQE